DQSMAETLTLSKIVQKPDNSIVARAPAASIAYEFGADTLRLLLTNTTDHTPICYVVVDLRVTAVSPGDRHLLRIPRYRDWPDTIWYADKSKVKITGGRNIWGMWLGSYQVWETLVEAGQTKQVQWDIGPSSAEELARLDALAGRLIETSKYSARIETDGC